MRTTHSRRDFLKLGIAGVAGAGTYGALSASSWSRVLGANDDVRVAVAGIRSKGKHHIQMLSKIPGVRIVALCDCDRRCLDEQVKDFDKRGQKVTAYTDVRRLLEDADVDAVSTATPNHWHALLTVWACESGKDVYVEKPVSHTIWEGRRMVEAAREHGRIVQSGVQKRSDRGPRDAFAFLQGGEVGRILWARGLCYKRRESIGKVTGPQQPPSTVDYDLWCGPAPNGPLQRRNLHYDWHWVWDTGNGDIGNQGIHEMDLARWALGQKRLAPSVISLGGRLGYDDDGQTPNTQVAYFDYQPAPLIFEVRGLPMKSDSTAMDHFRASRIGVVIQCEGGYFAGGEGGGWLYDNEGRKIRQFTGGGAGNHHANWIDAIRTRTPTTLTADIEEGHLSSALCHMANISYRVGRTAPPEEIAEAVAGRGELAASFERMKEHLARNGIDIAASRLTLGAPLAFDADRERFTGALAPQANALVSRTYRAPFVVPEKA